MCARVHASRSSRMNMRMKLMSSNPQQTQMARMSVNSVTRLPRPAPAAKTLGIGVLKAAGERDEDRCAEGIGHLPVKMMTVLHTAPRLS